MRFATPPTSSPPAASRSDHFSRTCTRWPTIGRRWRRRWTRGHRGASRSPSSFRRFGGGFFASARLVGGTRAPVVCRSIDLSGELPLDGLGVEWLHHVGELRILRQTMPEPRVEAGNELKGLGDLLLRAQQDVQRDLLPQLGDACLTTLRHEDENGEEDRLERDNHREQTERERVDRLETRDETGVPEDPGGEPEHMRGEEIAGARHAR